MEPLISIIIPVYNNELYVGQCVQSILQQSYKNIEIVAVDDGSTDGSLQVLNSIADKEKRLLVIHQKNKGVTKARLTGVSASHGDWIGFVDSDDIVDERMYEHLLNNANKNSSDISHCGYQIIFENEDTRYYYNTGVLLQFGHQEALAALLKGNLFEPSLCNKLFRRQLFQQELIEKMMLQPFKNYEDLLMNYYLFCQAHSSVFEDICLYHYRKRDNSASRGELTVNKLYDPLLVLKTIRSDLKDQELITLIDCRIVNMLIEIVIRDIGKQKDSLFYYQNSAKEELRQFASTSQFRDINKKLKGKVMLALYTPKIYRYLHRLYRQINEKK